MALAATTTVHGLEPATGQSLTVEVKDGLIHTVQRAPAAVSAAGQGWLAAGLIDLQVNGYAGHDLNDDRVTPETVQALARAMLASGVTTF